MQHSIQNSALTFAHSLNHAWVYTHTHTHKLLGCKPIRLNWKISALIISCSLSSSPSSSFFFLLLPLFPLILTALLPHPLLSVTPSFFLSFPPCLPPPHLQILPPVTQTHTLSGKEHFFSLCLLSPTGRKKKSLKADDAAFTVTL